MYIINDVIICNFGTKELTNLITNKKAKITNTVVNLIQAIFEFKKINPDKIVSREDLIKRVFEDNNNISSSNSLNSAISFLRRGLDDLGCENVIDTVPKKGYKFNITITKIDSDKKKSNNKIVIVFCVLITLTLILVVYLNKFFKVNSSVSKDECSIIYSATLKNKEVSADINHMKMHCKKGVVYFDAFGLTQKGDYAEEFSATCSNLNTNEECVNVLKINE